MTSSGKIRLEKGDTGCSIFVDRGFFRDFVITITLDHLDSLLFIAGVLGYSTTNLGRSGLIAMNEVSIEPTPTDEYDIKLGLNFLTLCETDMESLMKCLKYFDGYESDDPTLEYGLKKDNRPTVRTIRGGKLLPGYSPNITGDHFGISVEDTDEITIYLLTDSGDWVDVFTLYDVDDIAHIKQAFCMVKDAMDWSQPVYISSHGGVFDYEPEYDDRFVKVSIGGEIHLFGGEDISDLIRVIDRMN